MEVCLQYGTAPNPNRDLSVLRRREDLRGKTNAKAGFHVHKRGQASAAGEGD